MLSFHLPFILYKSIRKAFTEPYSTTSIQQNQSMAMKSSDKSHVALYFKEISQWPLELLIIDEQVLVFSSAVSFLQILRQPFWKLTDFFFSN